MRRNSSVEHVCHQIHRTLVGEFKYALVWGTSTKFNPQRVGLSHVSSTLFHPFPYWDYMFAFILDGGPRGRCSSCQEIVFFPQKVQEYFTKRMNCFQVWRVSMSRVVLLDNPRKSLKKTWINLLMFSHSNVISKDSLLSHSLCSVLVKTNNFTSLSRSRKMTVFDCVEIFLCSFSSLTGAECSSANLHDSHNNQRNDQTCAELI